MATQVAPLDLRLFLEGIEVPIISAQVVIQPGAPATAAIQIVPTDSALLFLPRTLVHLFSRDSSDVTPGSSTKKANPTTAREDTQRIKIGDEQYKLLFSGEMIGYNYTKTPAQRSFVLQCMDLSSYWDTCYQWYSDFSKGGSGFTDKHHHFVGAGEFVFNNISSGTKWVIGNVLQSRPDNPRYKNVKGILGGYIHLLEVIGGIRPKAGASYKSFRGVNDFFTIAELRYNLSGMIGAANNDTTSAKLFTRSAFRSWLQQGMASAGSLISFRDAAKLVGRYVFHEVYPNPAAFFVEEGTRIQDRVPERVNKTAAGKQAFKKMEDAKGQAESAAANLDFPTENPKVVQGELTLASMIEARDFLKEAIDLVQDTNASDVSDIVNLLLVAGTKLVTAITSFRSSSVVTETGYSISENAANAVVGHLNEAAKNIDRVVKVSTKRKKKEKDVTVTSGPHLFNQLLLPETWMLAPPRCNILFPDMYTQFSYSRNFLREVTRLHVKGGLGIISGGRSSAVLDKHYIAPNIRDVRNKIARKSVFRSSRTLLPHEIHSGIIPKLSWVTEGHRWGIKASKLAGKDALGKKIAYIQRLANFQFFNHRWGARQMSAHARFNPNMVVGFPGVIIDRATPSIAGILAAQDISDAGAYLLPTAYVGKVATLQHNVSQDGGTTNVVYTHARTHRGIDDEFLGVVAREHETTKKETETVAVWDLIEARRSNVETNDLHVQFVRMFVQGSLVPGMELPVATIDKVTPSDIDEEFTFEDLSLLSVSFDDFENLMLRQSDRRDQLTNSGNGVFIPSSFKVNISTRPLPGRYIRKGSSAFEEVVRPGWYDPAVWGNEKISEEVYLPLLGARAITDDSNVGDATQFANLVKTAVQNSDGLPHTVDVVEDDNGNLLLTIEGRPAANLGFGLTTKPSIESAIDGLTTLYGLLKKKDLDVQEFIDDYTRRPIATLIQVLGDNDLQYARSGNAQGVPVGDVLPRADGTIPFEGFHSRAFGPYNVGVKHRRDTSAKGAAPEAGDDALLALIPAGKRQEFLEAGTVIERTKKGTTIPGHMDPRGRSQARVRTYAAELAVTRGILAT